MGNLTELELSFLDWMQSAVRCAPLDFLMPLVSALGNAGIVWIVLTLLLLCQKKHRRTGLVLACALLLDLVCCNLILKPLVARIRPFDLHTAVQLLIARPHDFSFPSGHAAASFTAATALYCCRSRLFLPATVLALLIAFSRLYLYVHYPSDVFAGMLLGILVGIAGYRLVLAFFKRRAMPQ